MRSSAEPTGPIRLKDAGGKLIDFSDTDATRRLHCDVANINAEIGTFSLEVIAANAVRTRHHLIIDGAYYRPTAPVLYRVATAHPSVWADVSMAGGRTSRRKSGSSFS